MLPGPQSEQARLDLARGLMLRGELAKAESAILQALQEHPRSFDLRRILAGVYLRTCRQSNAESLLTELLAERPGDIGAAFTLARDLIGQCRSNAAAAVMRTCFEHARLDAELVIQAVELLDTCGRERDAEVIVQRAIKLGMDDPRLHAYAGMLEIQLGEFQRARKHYLFALEHAPQACEWHIPHGLALMQRYRDAQHPDFARFTHLLKQGDLSDKARSTLLFALAKAHDDIGDFAQAAAYSRQANSLAHKLTQWSRKQWRRAIEARLDANPIISRLEPQTDFVPVFVVGVPRSGTTLVSELLARRPRVCNRGESSSLPTLAQQANLIGSPDPAGLQHAAQTFAAQLRQDDASTMRWFIDKQPLNFRYVDLMLALFPNARVIHCRRDARDTALSLWMQSFHEEVQGYAYGFDDIALVMRDCEKLMAHWRKSCAGSIREVRYERLVDSPEEVIAQLATWLELPPSEARIATDPPTSGIKTASAWQARQPVYARSIGRWRNYLQYLPELSKFERG